MNTVFSIPISVATVQKASKTCAANVKPVVDRIEKKLKDSGVKGVDESGLYINGKINWLHTLCNDQLVKYRVSEKRGDVPKDLCGIVVHDHFASYYSQMPGVQHALCNAHHLRELKAVTEIDKEPWAKSMSRLLLLGNRKMLENHGASPPIEWIKKYKTLYLKIIAKGLAFHDCLGVLKKPSRGRIKRRPGHNLLLRLQNRSEDVLRFLTDPTVPFTNNQSEQSLRMIKVKLKTSGFRTQDGTEDFLAVRSYTATAQKQKIDVLDALTKAFYGRPINFA
jgi:transposase